jgi:hypothetical protein
LAVGPGKGVAETVTIRFVDHFGVPWQDCHVEEFTPADVGGGPDFASRFHGLIGHNIPFGDDCRLVLKCAKAGPFFPFFVAVGRERTFLVVSSWEHAGDYETGLAPRLTVSVVPRPRGGTGQAWVKVLGVYINHSESDGVDQRTGDARFYSILPGTYMVLLLTPEKLVCAKEIELLDAFGRLELEPTPNGCTAKALALVKVIE